MRTKNLIEENINTARLHRIYKFDNGYGAEVLQHFEELQGKNNRFIFQILKFDKQGKSKMYSQLKEFYEELGQTGSHRFATEEQVDKWLEKLEKIRG